MRTVVTGGREERLRAPSSETADRAGPTDDELAYAALLRDGEVHPWTREAESLWACAAGRDPYRDHDRAVLHHARAYDLEAAGNPEAFRHWTAALRYWASVLDDDDFWDRTARELAEHMGDEVPGSLVQDVRRRLPRELMEPHRDLIAAYRGTDPQRAARHVRVLVAAPFDPELADGIRAEFAEESLAEIPGAIRAAEFDRAVEATRQFRQIDPRNVLLLRAQLYVFRSWNEHLHVRGGDGRDVAANVDRAQHAIDEFGVTPPRDPADEDRYTALLASLRPLGSPPGALAAEIARHEVWRGFVRTSAADDAYPWDTGPTPLSDAERDLAAAVEHLRRAHRLDPDLGLDGYYADAAAQTEAGAELLTALARMERYDHVGAAGHCRRAAVLDPTDPAVFTELARALLGAEPCTVAALTEAEQALDRADGLVGASDRDGREMIDSLRRLLDLRRTATLGR